jgi:hypothetical protein
VKISIGLHWATAVAPAAAVNVLKPATLSTVRRATVYYRSRCFQRRVAAGACRIVLVAACMLVSGTHGNANAAQTVSEERRFPKPHITKAQWEAFFAETLSKPGAIVIDRADITRIVVPQESAVFFFTKRSHFTHPAAARRAMVTYGNRIYIHTSGYYAGNRSAFLLWMKAFTDQDRNLQRDLNSPPGSVKARVDLVKRLSGMVAIW